MSKLNVFGWMTLALTLTFAASGCCGGSADAAAGGGGGEEAAKGGGQTLTCNDVGSISQCSQHTGGSMELLGEDFYKSMCELTSGTWGAEACPEANVVGRCDDGMGSITVYYGDGGTPYTADSAKESCEFLDGKFSS